MKKALIAAATVATIGLVATQLPAGASPYPVPSTTIPIVRTDCHAVAVAGNDVDDDDEVESVTVFLYLSDDDTQCTWTINSDDEAELQILVAVLELLGIVDDGDDEFEVH